MHSLNPSSIDTSLLTYYDLTGTRNGGYETVPGEGGGGGGGTSSECECEEKGYAFTKEDIVKAVLLTLFLSLVLNVVSWVLCKFNPFCKDTDQKKTIVVQQMPDRASGGSGNPIHKL